MVVRLRRSKEGAAARTAWERYLKGYYTAERLVYDWYWWAYTQGKFERLAVAEAQGKVLN